MNKNILIRRILVSLTIFISLLVSCKGSTIKKSTLNSFKAVHLPDNSIALLNNNSSIEFDQDFNERTIKQTGEVFYIVRKGNTPFIIETEKGKIKVIGTEFNVKSLEEELEVEVEKGIVKLKTNTLEKEVKKGQKALVNNTEKGIKIGKAEFKYKKWKKNLDKDLKKIYKKIKKTSKKVGKEVKKELKNLKK
ncbi:FecR domain-containing protein [Tenacibaculum caenipelagi]|uniref:FecR family protein n=1 Tax=Tenacibaculum caenipelagi TaxID=1325435 RepID=A0A4R6TJY6_9FLAO|nr:FecR family protein [Tenacibaculum caenipelagi]TDQ29818.1 FecR family protein [Tenacibaculum caenipelagi]